MRPSDRWFSMRSPDGRSVDVLPVPEDRIGEGEIAEHYVVDYGDGEVELVDIDRFDEFQSDDVVARIDLEDLWDDGLIHGREADAQIVMKGSPRRQTVNRIVFEGEDIENGITMEALSEVVDFV